MKTTRVLIADPCPVLCEGLAALLRRQGPGWEVCGLSAPGPAATEKAEELRPDVVILSHGHPGCDGLRTAREIRRRSRRTAVLLFSEARSAHDLREVVSSAVAGGLLKSETCDEVLFALEAVRRRGRFRSRALLRSCPKRAAGPGRATAVTPSEMENLRLIAHGHSVKETAAKLGVSNKTSETHRLHLYRKFGVHCAVELTRCAIRQGYVQL